MFTFKKDSPYCDAEVDLHLGIFFPMFWLKLRKHLAAVGITPEFPILLQVKGVIEEGALIYHGHTTLSKPDAGFEYENEYSEDIHNYDPTTEPEPPPGFTGIWTRFHPIPDGTKSSETTYVDGRKEGRITSFAEDGRRLREGYKVNGQWHGTMSIWGENENLIDQSEWVNGTGTYRIFYCSGVLAVEQQFLHGKRHGVLRKWNEHGELTVTAYYEDGQLVRHEGLGDPR